MTCRWLPQISLLIILFLPPGMAEGQSGTRRPRTVDRAQGKTLSSADQEPWLPRVAVSGCDVVALVDSGEILEGRSEFQTRFDGQIYRFHDAANRKRFESDPNRFAPVLAGSSIVRWRDQLERIPGNPKNKILFEGRLYLFSDEREKEAFAANSARYVDSDLILGGDCPVTLVEQAEIKQGDVGLQTVFAGYRIRFADQNCRRSFLQHPEKYFPTMGGVDPVSYVNGTPQLGMARFAIVYKERLYLLASAENRDKFLSDPRPYSDADVADGGVCPVTLLESGKRVRGHYAVSAVFLGRRYLFAGPQERLRFQADPDKFLPAGK